MSDTSNSGIFVIEGLSRGQSIPVDRPTVTAFVGPCPRGPVDRPVAVSSIEEYLRNFGVPGVKGRLEHAIQQYFSTGGQIALVVRVAATQKCNTISLPGAEGALNLIAVHPGSHEYLRGSIDYDGIPADRPGAFNLVIQRLRSPTQKLIYDQEIFPGVSIDEESDDFVAHALLRSDLVRVSGAIPGTRPDATISLKSTINTIYIECEREPASNESPSDYDLIGSSVEGRGLFALDEAAAVDMICLLSGSADRDLGPVALLAADRYCRSRQVLLIIDPPSDWATVKDVVDGQHQSPISSPNVLAYFPRLAAHPGSNLPSPVSALGAVAGSLAARDQRHGIASPVHADIQFHRGRYKPACALTDNDVSLLARLGVNSLVAAPRLQVRIDGGVTLARFASMASEWSNLGRRRAALFALGSIRRGTSWVAFSENDAELWAEVRQQLEAFLTALYANGKLPGDSITDAFFVKCDGDTNAELLGRQGQSAFVVGFASGSPGDYLAFRFLHCEGSCTVTELGWRSALALAS